jgi:uncharacterized Zn finger protein
MASQQKSVASLLSPAIIQELSLPSNFRYGAAIYERGAVEFIKDTAGEVEAWTGGLNGSVAEGGGSRRRTQLFASLEGLKWHCTGNPKKHQIFCKHCVALALAIVNRGDE